MFDFDGWPFGCRLRFRFRLMVYSLLFFYFGTNDGYFFGLLAWFEGLGSDDGRGGFFCVGSLGLGWLGLVIFCVILMHFLDKNHIWMLVLSSESINVQLRENS